MTLGQETRLSLFYNSQGDTEFQQLMEQVFQITFERKTCTNLFPSSNSYRQTTDSWSMFKRCYGAL